jgi:hypothetical protein
MIITYCIRFVDTGETFPRPPWRVWLIRIHPGDHRCRHGAKSIWIPAFSQSQEHACFTVHEPHMLRLLFLHMLSTRYGYGLTSVGSVRSRIVPNHTQSYRIINTHPAAASSQSGKSNSQPARHTKKFHHIKNDLDGFVGCCCHAWCSSEPAAGGSGRGFLFLIASLLLCEKGLVSWWRGWMHRRDAHSYLASMAEQRNKFELRCHAPMDVGYDLTGGMDCNVPPYCTYCTVHTDCTE